MKYFAIAAAFAATAVQAETVSGLSSALESMNTSISWDNLKTTEGIQKASAAIVNQL
jgi:hypothetical protein